MASEEASGGGEAAALPNPFDSGRKKKTLKWCLWHVLTHHFPHGATINQLLAQGSPLLELFPSLKTNRNPPGQVGAASSWDARLHRGQSPRHAARHAPSLTAGRDAPSRRRRTPGPPKPAALPCPALLGCQQRCTGRWRLAPACGRCAGFYRV